MKTENNKEENSKKKTKLNTQGVPSEPVPEAPPRHKDNLPNIENEIIMPPVKDPKKEKETIKKVEEIFRNMKKSCAKHFDKIKNRHNCELCIHENVCVEIFQNNYPRLWKLEKMVLK